MKKVYILQEKNIYFDNLYCARLAFLNEESIKLFIKELQKIVNKMDKEYKRTQEFIQTFEYEDYTFQSDSEFDYYPMELK